jgi:hypothetical protein
MSDYETKPGGVTYFDENLTKVDPTEALLQQRAKTHGDYTKTARISVALKETIRGEWPSENPPDYVLESLDLICTKIARILSGDPSHREHWDDIAGYAKLVAERLK